MFARLTSFRFNLRIRWLRRCLECHVTEISFLTESVTEVGRCCKEIVGIDLPECCLGTEFNLLTAAAYCEGVLDVARASGVTVPRALTLSRTPKKPHAQADPRRCTPLTSLPPRRRPPHRWPPRRRGPPARRSTRRRRPHPRPGAKEESARAAVANKSCCA